MQDQIIGRRIVTIMSNMASSTNGGLIMVWVLLQIMASALVLVKGDVLPGLTVTVENEFVEVGQTLFLHCTLNGNDLGQQELMPFNRFVDKFDPSFFGGDLFTCVFAASGKPTTTIDVYKGYAFAHRPCECLGIDYCFWQVLDDGFYCNTKFIQGWGN